MSDSDVVTWEKKGKIGLITVDNPPVNALSHAVREGLMAAIGEAGKDGDVEAVVLQCAGRTFIAGADISEFGKPPKDPDLRSVLAAIEDCPKPVIAAIHGTALGGGFEVALSCHYRCAVPSARVGLPEVKLGLLPGAGGTQRLPRLVGVERALDIILSGEQVGARHAWHFGAIDHVIEGNLEERALDYAERLVRDGAPLRKVSDIPLDDSGLPENFFDKYRAKIARKTKGLIAPENIVKCLEAAVGMPFEKAYKRERELFNECLESEQSAAQRYLFFAERQTAKVPDVPKDTTPREIETAGVIGAGTMGAGIAICLADAGIPVTIVEAKQDALDKGLAHIEKVYRDNVRKGRLWEHEFDDRLESIAGSLDYKDLADADLVIEAVFEDMGLKKTVFGELDKTCKPGAILASNTSTLDIDEIAATLRRPGDVLGLHFFSPANVMKLLEIVRAEKTETEVLATALKLAKAIRKVPVVSGVCYGFIGNRMMEGMIREAEFLLLEGGTPEEIDKAMTDFGMAMGPFGVMDLAGVDVMDFVRKGRPDDMIETDERYGAVIEKLVAEGRLGQKSGAGFYDYSDNPRKGEPDPAVIEMIGTLADDLKIEQRALTEDEIVQRLIYPLINEGARILEEGIALRASDIDVVYVYGYGFPPYKGGPMFHADREGLAHILDRIREFKEQDPIYWEPAPLLVRLAEEKGTFKDWKRED